MRLWDGELLTASKKSGVITDGLIAWVDGRDPIGGEPYKTTTSGIKHYINNPIVERVSGFNLKYTAIGTANDYPANDRYVYITEGTLPGFYEINQTYHHYTWGKITSDGTDFGDFKGVKTMEAVIRSGAIRTIPKIPNSTDSNGRISYASTWIGTVYHVGIIYNGSYKDLGTKDSGFLNSVHVVATNEGGKGVLYVNGVRQNLGNPTKTIVDFSDAIYFEGSSIGSTRARWLGSLRFYNRDLTEKEILQNYKYEQSLGRIGV